ncbi:hypothetical protein EBT31_00695 [bacterium]|nr:hypothetical protein [bacterium]
MKLRISDPLALLPYQTGVIFRSTSGSKVKDDPGTWLNTRQRSVELGTPVPIVFGLFVDNPGTNDDYGGVFVSPPATKIRYDLNTTTNEVTTKLTMVLSEGYVPQPLVQDVYQRTCKRGIMVWAYDKLAGPYFTAGNYTSGGGSVTVIFPSYAGSDAGTYEDMTTLYYTNQFAANDDTWQNQVHVFVRQGMHVTRLAGGGVGPSNNMVDLAYYLIQKTSRVPELLIDSAAMSVAAWFTEVNGFTWDGILDEPANLEDWMREMAGFFLLRVSEKNGKKGFRPLLPITLATYQIATGSVSWKFGFTEEHLVPDGFQIEYIPLSERKPICAQMMWRQQPPNDIGFVRSTEVRIDGEALEGPYEQYDMTQFCTREDHAVKVGAYQVARRKYVTHSLRIRVKPDSYNTLLVLGDIVRVQLRRENDPGVVSFHDYLYEIEKINKTETGVVEFDLMHFPIDSLGRSILALYVAGAEGTGYMYDLGRNEYSCDDPDNVNDDDPVAPTDPGDGNNPDTPDTDVDLPQPGTDLDNPPNDAPVFTPGSEIGGGPGGTTGIPASGSPTGNNPADPFDDPAPVPSISGTSGAGNTPLPGDELTASEVCPGQYNTWYLVDVATGEETVVSEGVAAEYIIADPDLTGKTVYVVGCCPDPSSPSGYGGCHTSAQTEPIGEPPVPPIYCPGGSDSGGQGTFTRLVNVGEGLGSFTFSWTAYSIPDRFVVSGAASYDTGVVSGSGSASLTKTSTNPWITVTVIAPLSGTAWVYSVGCAS